MAKNKTSSAKKPAVKQTDPQKPGAKTAKATTKKQASIPPAKKTAEEKLAPEMITISELARRARSTRSAASAWIIKQESEGLIIAQYAGRNKKLVDASDPLIQRYIDNVTGKANRKQGKENEGEKSPNTLRKLRYQGEKMWLQNNILREKYLDRETAWAICDKLIEIEGQAYAGFSERVLSKIEKEFKITIDPKQRQDAKEMLDEAVEKAHESTVRIIQDFKAATAPHATENTAAR